MTTETHRKRHEELHKHLVELVEDMITVERVIPRNTTVKELLEWSCLQTLPTQTADTIEQNTRQK